MYSCRSLPYLQCTVHTHHGCTHVQAVGIIVPLGGSHDLLKLGEKKSEVCEWAKLLAKWYIVMVISGIVQVVFMMLCNEALTYCTCISHCVDFADLTFIMSVL